MKVSVILPSRNEEKTIGICIEKINRALKGKSYEIIVSDSSSDRSAEIAKSYKNVKVIKHNLYGYGNAILQGIEEAEGDYIIIGDADDTYDFSEIPKFVSELDKGYDFVIGKRSRIEKGAMPFSHRYIGTPLFNFLISWFFGKKVSDINSGFRGIRREKLQELNLKTTGMELASEMIVKAAKKGLKIKEIPISYSKRKGESKLRALNDGWKHLRFIFLYSPNYIFLWTGLILLILGFLIMSLILTGKLVLFGIHFKTHPLFIGAALVILGYQLILTGISARIYAHNHLGEKDDYLERLYHYFTLEKGIFAGLSLIFFGFLIYLYVLIKWLAAGFGELDTINISIFALTFIVLGLQTIFSGFFFSMVGIKES